PSHNHWQKLDQVLKILNADLPRFRLTKAGLEEYYRAWQRARYSHTEFSPREASAFRLMGYRLRDLVLEHLASQTQSSIDAMEEDLHSDLLGDRWLSCDQHVSYVHDKWQSELEAAGERGQGSKLGNKLANPSNFCHVSVLTDDPVTKRILADDAEVGYAIGQLYDSFLRLMQMVQDKRGNKGVGIAEIMNYTFSLRLRHSGCSLAEMGELFFGLGHRQQEDKSSET
ncbi:MAG: hypothetical protein ACRD3M_16465, partial [Thermoanaerobaculia bacterium]